MTNKEKSKNLINLLKSKGVRDFCVCSGARNIPLIEELSKDETLNIYSFFNENSAGFFALGLMKNSLSPACVVTTSGTAVGELLPSVMEAYYSNLKLIVLSSDRPRAYRKTGAPQSVEQKGIFSHYLSDEYDLEDEVKISNINGPTHINISFSEPLLDEFVKKTSININLDSFDIRNCKKPVIIISGLSKHESYLVIDQIKNLKLPLLVEGHSNLFKETSNYFNRCFSPEDFFSLLKNYKFDSIIRIGSIPTNRFWRDLEFLKLPVFSFSSQKFSGLSYIKDKPYDIKVLSKILSSLNSKWSSDELKSINEKNRSSLNKIKELYLRFPDSEQALFYKLFLSLKEDQNLFIGNSSPIRMLDLVIDEDFKANHVYSNRGTNGIDGLISTSMGLLNGLDNLVSVVGDLSALYDLSGLWPLHSFLKKKNKKFSLVIFNNSGGELFTKVFSDSKLSCKSRTLLKVPHEMNFLGLAKLWDLNYFENFEDEKNFTGLNLIEIRPDNLETHEFWRLYKESLV